MSTIIDINVTPTVQDVTINTVENVTVINVNTNSGGGGVQSVVAGENVTVDNTDPQNPIVSATGGGGGDFIPLSGTEVGSPVTGDIAFFNDNFSKIKQTNGDIEVSLYLDSAFEIGLKKINNDSTFSALVLDGTNVLISSTLTGSKGILGNTFFDKLNDPNAFAQLGDIPNVETDLAYTPSPTNGIVTSSTGTDATIPLANNTNAGLLSPTVLSEIGNNIARIATIEAEQVTQNTAISANATNIANLINSLPLKIADATLSAGVTATVSTLAKDYAIGKLNGKKILTFKNLAHKVGSASQTMTIEIRLFDTVLSTEISLGIVTSNAGSGMVPIERQVSIDQAGGFLRVLNNTVTGNANDSITSNQNITEITIPNVNNDLTFRVYLRNGGAGSECRQYSALIELI